MESNQLNSPKVFSHKGQGKDTQNLPIKLNPVFDDLNNPATILNHVEGLQKTVEAEQKAKQNPFPVVLFLQLK